MNSWGKLLLTCVLLVGGSLGEDTRRVKFRLRRIIRDVTGHYHHVHTEVHSHSPPPQIAVAAPLVEAPLAPNCGCYVRGRCAEKLKSFTELVIRTRASQLVCGSQTELCCFEDDPWPGVVDTFSHLAPCVPDNLCTRVYGTLPTDVRDFGTIGNCPGLGSVRCLDNLPPVVIPQQPEGPIHVVVPIIEDPPRPPHQQPPTVYEPPAETEPPTTVPPPTGYNYPDPPPSPVYGPPQAVPVVVEQPPPVYAAPPPTSYAAPEPVDDPPQEIPPTPIFPSTSYGVPGVPHGQPFVGYQGQFGFPYGGSRWGSFFPGFGGFGFRKHLSFHKGFGFFR